MSKLNQNTNKSGGFMDVARGIIIAFGVVAVAFYFTALEESSNYTSSYQSGGWNACDCSDILSLPQYVKGSDKWKISACRGKYGGPFLASRECTGIDN